jgi:NAD(P)H-dependent FMN reductase
MPMSAANHFLITIISGTNRPDSRTRTVAEQSRRIYHDLGCEVWLIDLAAFKEGTFDPEKEPEGFKEIADLFVAAKGIVIVTPEESGEIPNILKYFFAWIRQRVTLQARPVAFVGLSDEDNKFSAQAPVDQLHEMFGAGKNGYIYPVRMIIPDAANRVHKDGQIDEADAAKLKKHAEGFIGFCQRMKAGSKAF